MKKFIEYTLASLTKDSTQCAVLENHSNDVYKLTVCVPRDELGKVIGKNGQMANALRTISNFHAQKIIKKKLVFSITEKNAVS